MPVTPTQATPDPAGIAEPALSVEQLATLNQARLRAKKIQRAATVAAISGWTMLVFAFITLLAGIFSPINLLVGAGLLVISIVEIRAVAGLRRFQTATARHLGWNQLVLASLITGYGIYCVVAAVMAESPYAAHIATGGKMAEMLEPIDQLNRMLSIALGAGICVFGIIAPPLTALYYFTRRGVIESFLRETPDWAIETFRAVR